MPFGMFIKQISHFNNTLLFINTNYTQATHFYKFLSYKSLNNKKICMMLTKNNVGVHKKNIHES